MWLKRRPCTQWSDVQWWFFSSVIFWHCADIVDTGWDLWGCLVKRLRGPRGDKRRASPANASPDRKSWLQCTHDDPPNTQQIHNDMQTSLPDIIIISFYTYRTSTVSLTLSLSFSLFLSSTDRETELIAEHHLVKTHLNRVIEPLKCLQFPCVCMCVWVCFYVCVCVRLK